MEHSHTENYVWLNINTGEFGRSWTTKEFPSIDIEGLANDNKLAKEQGWKLLRYTCLNDSEFQFNNWMKIR